MNSFENINVSLSGNLLLLLLGLSIIFAYTFYIYRTTLPPVSNFAKGTLIFIRILALSLLLFLIFDPILKITTTEKIDPKTLVFIDNSKSISEFSTTEDLAKVQNLLNELNSEANHNIDFFTFGSTINKINSVDNEKLTFNSTSTEFESILNKAKNTNNVASIIIISDGLSNEGKNPLYEFNELEMPIYTIGIGDTSTYSDIIVERINSNDFIYTERETDIEVIIRNENLSDDKISIQLFDNDQLVQSKSIQLSNNGINRVSFPYAAKTEGEHKITAKVSSRITEQNKFNNSKSRLINVLASKKKITVLSGGPSPDLSTVVNSIEENDDFEVSKIIELSRNNFYKNQYNLDVLKESDVIFLIGFPSINSNADFIKNVSEIITKENKNIILLLSNTIDFTKINDLKQNLPFKIENISDDFSEVMVKINNSSGSLLGDSEPIKNAWKNLPPINITKTKLIPNAISQILLDDKSGTIPIIFSSNDGTRKSIVVNAVNIWRWKIRSSDNHQLFDNFILNSIKWLSIYGEKQFFNVSIPKKSYLLGEKINFNVSLYDETFEPLNNQEIVLSLSSPTNKYEYSFSQIADGIYEVEVILDEPGQYHYTARLVNNPRKLKSVSGNINIDPIELELVERKVNSRFLESISFATGGKYSKIDETDFLINEIDKNYNNEIKYKLIDKELRLSNLEVILLIIVLLFSIEWIIRKVLRMI